MKGDAKKLVCL